MRILITGSTGFIGGSVGRFAAAAGHDVTGIARRSQPDPNWPGRHFAADVSSADLAGTIRAERPDAIFHGAGSASVAASLESPLEDFRAAAMTFANLMDSVRRSGLAPLVIFPSSAAVYGNPVTSPVNEDATLAPISPYGFHKLSCEIIAREYCTCFGLNVLVFRVFSVLGPAQRRLLAWEIFKQLRGADTVVQLRGSGQESRDYLHVEDLAAAVLAAAEAVTGYGVLNLASGIETRIADLAHEMIEMVAPSKRVEYLGQHFAGDPLRWSADINRIRSLIPSWNPRPISDALGHCISHWMKLPIGGHS